MQPGFWGGPNSDWNAWGSASRSGRRRYASETSKYPYLQTDQQRKPESPLVELTERRHAQCSQKANFRLFDRRGSLNCQTGIFSLAGAYIAGKVVRFLLRVSYRKPTNSKIVTATDVMESRGPHQPFTLDIAITANLSDLRQSL